MFWTSRRSPLIWSQFEASQVFSKKNLIFFGGSTRRCRCSPCIPQCAGANLGPSHKVSWYLAKCVVTSRWSQSLTDLTSRRESPSTMEECAFCHTLASNDQALHFCSGCRQRKYCNQACQRAAWRAGHRERATKEKRPFLCGPGFRFVGSSICGGPQIFANPTNICGPPQIDYPTNLKPGPHKKGRFSLVPL